jgi:hypothetical protein
MRMHDDDTEPVGHRQLHDVKRFGAAHQG